MGEDINQELTAHLGLNTDRFKRNLRGASSEAKAEGKKMETAFGGVSTKALAVASAVAAVATGMAAAAVAAGKMAQSGGRALGIQSAFFRSAGGGVAALRDLEAATEGLLTRTDLMARSNEALQDGIASTVGQFERQARVAIEMGRAVGMDAKGSIDELIKGEDFAEQVIARTNDELGAQVDITRNAGDAWTGLEVEISNTTTAINQWLANSGALKSFFDTLAGGLAAARDNASFLASTIPIIGGAFAGRGGTPFQPGPPTSRGLGSSAGSPFQMDGISVTARRRPFRPRIQRNLGFDVRAERGQAFTPQLPGGFDVPGVSPLGLTGNQESLRSFERGLEKTSQRTRQMREDAQRLQETIVGISDTVENVLVRALTKAVMQFESIGALIEDIGRSLLSSVLGGLVSFGIGALQTSILGAVGIGTGGAGIVAGGALKGALGVRTPGASFSMNISSSDVPEPTDYGILGSKAGVQKLLVATLKNARRNGVAI